MNVEICIATGEKFNAGVTLSPKTNCRPPHAVLPKAVSCRAKEHLLPPERPPFTKRKTPFCSTIATSCKSACCRRKDGNTKNAAAYQRTSASVHAGTDAGKP